MFKLFKSTQKQMLQKKYEKLLREAFELSHTNRKASDQKRAEAEELALKIKKIKDEWNFSVFSETFVNDISYCLNICCIYINYKYHGKSRSNKMGHWPYPLRSTV